MNGRGCVLRHHAQQIKHLPHKAKRVRFTPLKAGRHHLRLSSKARPDTADNLVKMRCLRQFCAE